MTSIPPGGIQPGDRIRVRASGVIPSTHATLTTVHDFAQADGVDSVRVCRCGKWPDHHVHTGLTMTCTCDACNPQTPES